MLPIVRGVGAFEDLMSPLEAAVGACPMCLPHSTNGTYVELGSWAEGETVAVDDPVTVRFDPAALRP